MTGAGPNPLFQGAFFFLLQSEDGDLYKVTIEHETIKQADADEAYVEVKNLKIKYFDTVPTATGLCILKSGFLFVASEFGNQLVCSISSPYLTLISPTP